MAKILLVDEDPASSGSETITLRNDTSATIRAKCPSGGTFDFDLKATATDLDGDDGVSIVPVGTTRTGVSDILLEVGPTGSNALTFSWSNLSNNSEDTHTITASTGYVDSQNVNTNSTFVTDAGPRTGTLTRTVTGLSCAPGADIDLFSCDSALVNNDTGKTLAISGSADGDNDDNYTVTYVSATSATVIPDFSSPDDDTTTPGLTAVLSLTLTGPDLAPGGDLSRLHVSAPQFSTGDVTRTVTITGSATPANDGVYTADSFVDAQNIELDPPLSATDPGGGTLVVVISVILTGVSLAPGTLTKRVTAGADRFSAYDEGRSLIIPAGANAGTYEVATFNNAQSIDLVEDLPAITTSTSGTIVGEIEDLDLAPGGDVDRVHADAAAFAEVDEGATLEIVGSEWPLSVFVKTYSAGVK